LGCLDKHRLFFGKGMLSDDTEHSLMVAVAMASCPHDVVAFQAAFAKALRWWFAAFPAGIGLGTAKAIIRLWLGFHPSQSGVDSAGNGAAMRSAIIGVVYREDALLRRQMVEAASRVTHTDQRAIEAALLAAEAAALFSLDVANNEILEALGALICTDEMRSRWMTLCPALGVRATVRDYAQSIGCGSAVSGFAPNSIAVAIFATLRHRQDIRTAITEVIACGGDTDSVAAITGGIMGAETGEAGIPDAWIANIRDWPRSIDYLRRVAAALDDPDKKRIVPHLHYSTLLGRNMVFLGIVLGHGLRRLLPSF
jgi:ADP-ribosyl-[dinitrogen reductase] hydrolase